MTTQALATFNDEVLKAHREALHALRQIISDETLTTTPPSDESPEDRAKRRTLTQRISLRLRAAVAILRTKLLETPSDMPAETPATETLLQAIGEAFSYARTSPLTPARALTAAAGAASPFQPPRPVA